MHKIKNQRTLLTEIIMKKLQEGKVYEGIPESVWRKSKEDPVYKTPIPYKTIPGIKEVGFDDE